MLGHAVSLTAALGPSSGTLHIKIIYLMFWASRIQPSFLRFDSRIRPRRCVLTPPFLINNVADPEAVRSGIIGTGSGFYLDISVDIKKYVVQ